MTWPLVRHAGTVIASDLGDPVFNCWVLSWTGGQVLAALHGHVHALADYWNGNVFYPAKTSLAFSEHLTPEMIEILPLYAATGNIVLSYNVLFVLTFALSGLAMFAFIRDVTGRTTAAITAGVAFAFAPYRLEQLSHVQVLSCFWMPLAFLGLRRFMASGRTRALVGATTAIVLQGLSCGYYLFFFTPFAAAYALHEMTVHRRWTDARVWRALAMATVAALVVLAPFVAPVLAVERAGDLTPRTISETAMFSADTRSFATAPVPSRLWGGRLEAFPKIEGAAFPGFTILAFAAIGVVANRRRTALRRPAAPVDPVPVWRRMASLILGIAAVATAGVIVAILVEGRVTVALFHHVLMVQSVRPYLTWLAVIGVLALTFVPDARAFAARVATSTAGFASVAALAAAWLALGPKVQAAGHVIGDGPYLWLFLHVPGFDSLRVPARFLMLVALFLAVLCGLGAAALHKRWPRAGIVLCAAGSIGILAEAWMVPMPVGMSLRQQDAAPAAVRLDTGSSVSPLYSLVRKMPGRVLLIEFPFGDPADDILAEFYAGYHRRPLVNGYSGFFPPRYADLSAALGNDPVARNPTAAAEALAGTGATVAIVHESAFPADEGAQISAWLRSTGATLLAADSSNKLFRLR